MSSSVTVSEFALDPFVLKLTGVAQPVVTTTTTTLAVPSSPLLPSSDNNIQNDSDRDDFSDPEKWFDFLMEDKGKEDHDDVDATVSSLLSELTLKNKDEDEESDDGSDSDEDEEVSYEREQHSLNLLVAMKRRGEVNENLNAKKRFRALQRRNPRPSSSSSSPETQSYQLNETSQTTAPQALLPGYEFLEAILNPQEADVAHFNDGDDEKVTEALFSIPNDDHSLQESAADNGGEKEEEEGREVWTEEQRKVTFDADYEVYRQLRRKKNVQFFAGLNDEEDEEGNPLVPQTEYATVRPERRQKVIDLINVHLEGARLQEVSMEKMVKVWGPIQMNTWTMYLGMPQSQVKAYKKRHKKAVSKMDDEFIAGILSSSKTVQVFGNTRHVRVNPLDALDAYRKLNLYRDRPLGYESVISEKKLCEHVKVAKELVSTCLEYHERLPHDTLNDGVLTADTTLQIIKRLALVDRWKNEGGTKGKGDSEAPWFAKCGNLDEYYMLPMMLGGCEHRAMNPLAFLKSILDKDYSQEQEVDLTEGYRMDIGHTMGWLMNIMTELDIRSNRVEVDSPNIRMVELSMTIVSKTCPFGSMSQGRRFKTDETAPMMIKRLMVDQLTAEEMIQRFYCPALLKVASGGFGDNNLSKEALLKAAFDANTPNIMPDLTTQIKISGGNKGATKSPFIGFVGDTSKDKRSGHAQEPLTQLLFLSAVRVLYLYDLYLTCRSLPSEMEDPVWSRVHRPEWWGKTAKKTNDTKDQDKEENLSHGEYRKMVLLALEKLIPFELRTLEVDVLTGADLRTRKRTTNGDNDDDLPKPPKPTPKPKQTKEELAEKRKLLPSRILQNAKTQEEFDAGLKRLDDEYFAIHGKLRPGLRPQFKSKSSPSSQVHDPIQKKKKTATPPSTKSTIQPKRLKISDEDSKDLIKGARQIFGLQKAHELSADKTQAGIDKYMAANKANHQKTLRAQLKKDVRSFFAQYYPKREFKEEDWTYEDNKGKGKEKANENEDGDEGKDSLLVGGKSASEDEGESDEEDEEEENDEDEEDEDAPRTKVNVIFGKGDNSTGLNIMAFAGSKPVDKPLMLYVDKPKDKDINIPPVPESSSSILSQHQQDEPMEITMGDIFKKTEDIDDVTGSNVQGDKEDAFIQQKMRKISQRPSKGKGKEQVAPPTMVPPPPPGTEWNDTLVDELLQGQQPYSEDVFDHVQNMEVATKADADADAIDEDDMGEDARTDLGQGFEDDNQKPIASKKIYFNFVNGPTLVLLTALVYNSSGFVARHVTYSQVLPSTTGIAILFQVTGVNMPGEVKQYYPWNRFNSEPGNKKAGMVMKFDKYAPVGDSEAVKIHLFDAVDTTQEIPISLTMLQKNTLRFMHRVRQTHNNEHTPKVHMLTIPIPLWYDPDSPVDEKGNRKFVMAKAGVVPVLQFPRLDTFTGFRELLQHNLGNIRSYVNKEGKDTEALDTDLPRLLATRMGNYSWLFSCIAAAFPHGVPLDMMNLDVGSLASFTPNPRDQDPNYAKIPDKEKIHRRNVCLNTVWSTKHPGGAANLFRVAILGPKNPEGVTLANASSKKLHHVLPYDEPVLRIIRDDANTKEYREILRRMIKHWDEKPQSTNLSGLAQIYCRLEAPELADVERMVRLKKFIVGIDKDWKDTMIMPNRDPGWVFNAAMAHLAHRFFGPNPNDQLTNTKAWHQKLPQQNWNMLYDWWSERRNKALVKSIFRAQITHRVIDFSGQGKSKARKSGKGTKIARQRRAHLLYTAARGQIKINVTGILPELSQSIKEETRRQHELDGMMEDPQADRNDLIYSDFTYNEFQLPPTLSSSSSSSSSSYNAEDEINVDQLSDLPTVTIPMCITSVDATNMKLLDDIDLGWSVTPLFTLDVDTQIQNRVFVSIRLHPLELSFDFHGPGFLKDSPQFRKFVPAS